MPAAGPVRAVLTMTVSPECAGEFELEWQRVAAWVERQPGCLRQTLARTNGPESTYVITSDWVDGSTYRQFETSPRQDEITAGLRALRTGVRMEVLTVIDHRETDHRKTGHRETGQAIEAFRDTTVDTPGAIH